MKEQPKKIVHPRDGEVWVNPTLEALRPSECLCLNCVKFKPGQPDHCVIAQDAYAVAVKHKVAFPMSRCPEHETKS